MRMGRQTVSFGVANVDLYSRHRRFGFKRSSFRAVAIELAGLLLLNPLVPQRLTNLPRGKWVAHAGLLVGRIKGSIRIANLLSVISIHTAIIRQHQRVHV